MNSISIANQRVLWDVRVQRTLTQAGFSFGRFANDYAVMFAVEHPSSRSWATRVDISSSKNRRNRLDVGYETLFSSYSKYRDERLVSALTLSLEKWNALAACAKVTEDAAAKWADRQEHELAGLPPVNGIDIQIIPAGPMAGQYALRFNGGHPLETLTKEELASFYAYLHAIKRVKLVKGA